MDYKIYLIISLLVISAISKAVMDTLNFHFDKSIFKKLNSKWLNSPEVTWENKYKWFPNSKFLTWVISNPLVFITDAWHLFGFFRDFLMYACIPILSGNYWVFLFYPIYRFIFHIFYTYIFTKK